MFVIFFFVFVVCFLALVFSFLALVSLVIHDFRVVCLCFCKGLFIAVCLFVSYFNFDFFIVRRVCFWDLVFI